MHILSAPLPPYHFSGTGLTNEGLYPFSGTGLINVDPFSGTGISDEGSPSVVQAMRV